MEESASPCRGTRCPTKTGAFPRTGSFSRIHQTLRHRDFLRLKASGTALRNAYVTLVFAPGSGHGSRLGVTVGKHVGKACERNRIKRLVREFFRLNRQRLGASWDIHIIVKKGTAGLDSARLFSELKTLFIKLSEHPSTRS